MAITSQNHNYSKKIFNGQVYTERTLLRGSIDRCRSTGMTTELLAEDWLKTKRGMWLKDRVIGLKSSTYHDMHSDLFHYLIQAYVRDEDWFWSELIDEK